VTRQGGLLIWKINRPHILPGANEVPEVMDFQRCFRRTSTLRLGSHPTRNLVEIQAISRMFFGQTPDCFVHKVENFVERAGGVENGPGAHLRTCFENSTGVTKAGNEKLPKRERTRPRGNPPAALAPLGPGVESPGAAQKQREPPDAETPGSV